MSKTFKDFINESSKVANLTKAINQEKKKLINAWKKRGGFENFGQKEVKKLENKFLDSSDYSREGKEIMNLLNSFDNWASNYDGS